MHGCSHLSNDGVEETPPSRPPLKGSGGGADATPTLDNLFVDLHGCNVGFHAFHPQPINHQGDRLGGISGMGGVWEWTSSVLEKWEGHEPMQAYPGYTGMRGRIQMMFVWSPILIL